VGCKPVDWINTWFVLEPAPADVSQLRALVGIEVVPANQSKVVLFASIFQERFPTGGKVVSTDYLRSFGKKSVNELPMKPAAPVTKTFIVPQPIQDHFPRV
jgi:hypothetical protein